MDKYRIEHDTLGAVKVPSKAYWGAQTERARQLYQISGLRIQPEFIGALLMIKEAAAMANKKTKALPVVIADAIVRACREMRADIVQEMINPLQTPPFQGEDKENISPLEGGSAADGREVKPQERGRGGSWLAQFPLDIYQSGAGTAQNMNVNEVVARKASELLKNKMQVHPNDHVNRSQSTNDTIPSAMYVASYMKIKKHLLPGISRLESALRAKAIEFKKIRKTGRTHLQDAVPMTLGDEFGAWADALAFHRKNLEIISEGLLEINLGGTAIGSGVNASAAYRKNAITELKKLSGHPFENNPNLFMGTQNLDAVLAVSGVLRNIASTLVKMAEDIRLLASGPISGMYELKLPAVQPGSSIMPGKVNPSVAEMLIMVCMQTIGMDVTIGECCRKGQLELNVMMPIVAFDILHMVGVMGSGTAVFAEKCVSGIIANEEKCRYYLERNPVIATALTPKLGYEKVAFLIKESYKSGKIIREVVLGSGLLTAREFDMLTK